MTRQLILRSLPFPTTPALALAATLAVCPDAGRADPAPESSFEGAATVRIAAGNVVSARRRALAAARRAAVEAAVASLVEDRRRAELHRPLRQRVLSDPARFVSTYRVLEERAVGGHYEVRMLARCRMAALRRVIAAIEASSPGKARQGNVPHKSRPAVSLSVERVAGSDGGRASPGGDALRAAVTRQLAAELRAAGIVVRTGSEGRGAAKKSAAGPAALRLVGRLEVSADKPVRGLGLATARARLRITGAGARSLSREVHAWGTGSSAARAAARAARAAALQMGPSLVDGLNAPRAAKRASGRRGYVVRLQGIERFAQLRALCRAITAGGVNCRLRQIGAREQRVVVSSGRTPDELARWLEGRSFGSLRLKRVARAGGALSFRVADMSGGAPTEDAEGALTEGP